MSKHVFQAKLNITKPKQGHQFLTVSNTHECFKALPRDVKELVRRDPELIPPKLNTPSATHPITPLEP